MRSVTATRQRAARVIAPIGQSVRWPWLVLWAVLLLPSIAAAQSVSYNYASSVNFSAFTTYEWVTIDRAEAVDPLLDTQIRKSIDTQLEKKGLTRASAGAQLLIAYQVSISREQEIVEYNARGSLWGYGPGWRTDQSYGYNHGYNFVSEPLASTTTGSSIYVGNLVLDIYDATYKDLIWRGQVSNALRMSDDAPERQQHLSKAAAKLCEPYPPRLKK